MATSLSQLVDDIAAALHAYTGVTEQLTWLTSNVSSTDLVLPVASSDAVLRGAVQIDDELIYVNSSDASGLQIAPFGRGFRNTNAAAHAADTMVTVDPIWPKADIVRAIQQCIDGLYPTLYAVKTVDLVAGVSTIGYEMPADCDGILKVEWKWVADVDNNWPQTYKYSFDANSAAFASGKAINLFEDLIQPGATVYVTYRGRFGTLSGSNTIEDIGLLSSASDLILYCVASRLVRFLEASRVELGSVENVARAQVVNAGSASNLANQLYAMYQQRLAEERRKLLTLYPVSPNFQR